ncbi:MAG: hypothetical protein NTW09_03485 [Candidatus Omnitrophica bacterium]|nr:hypothetical protein [Candidatus Omnitrophota bacterium]
MKKVFLLNLMVMLVITNALVLSSAMAQGASAEQDKTFAQDIKDAQGKAVITKVSSFSGTVVVKTGGQTIELVSGESVETLKGVMEKKPVNWADVAAYERMMANQEAPDPRKFQFTRWVLENLQTRRINRVLNELTAKLKSEYQKTHNGMIPRDDVLASYLPGQTAKERLASLDKVIDQVVEQLGLDPVGPLTFEGWKTKLVTSTYTLHDVDVKKLCEIAGLTQPPTDITHTDQMNDSAPPEGSQYN